MSGIRNIEILPGSTINRAYDQAFKERRKGEVVLFMFNGIECFVGPESTIRECLLWFQGYNEGWAEGVIYGRKNDRN